MKQISIVIASEGKDAITAQVETLRLLPEHIAHRVGDKLLGLLGGGRLDIAQFPLSPATGAGDDAVGLGIVGVEKLFATARAG